MTARRPPRPRSGVPLRHSLLLRLLAGSSVIALCSIAATTWLVMRGTTRAIEQQQVRQYAADAAIYNALLGYAATHPSWAGAQQFADTLTAGTDRRITLTTADRQVLLGRPVDGPPAASVDPLHVDPALLAAADQIDPRAVGPYALTDTERADQRATAEQALRCLGRLGYSGTHSEHPSGLITIQTAAPQQAKNTCGSDTPPLPLAAKVALTELGDLATACLSRHGGGTVSVRDPITWTYDTKDAGPDAGAARRCVDDARRQQLTPYVAAPALLFIHAPQPGTADTVTGPRFAASPANLARTGGAAALVLAVTIAVTVLAGFRLVRPLRTLTAAARHPTGLPPAPIAGHDEIAALAAALEEQSQRRERAEAQRKAMVDDIAHELRTPLSNIRSWLEATQDGLADPGKDPALTAALLAEAVQLQRIIDDLQDLAAADAGTLRLHRRPLDAADLVHQSVTAHRGSAEAAGSRLVVHVERPCPVDADPGRITQALGNLISNAVRHTPAGGTVTVTAARRPGPRATVELQVRDTGPGIAADDLPHVFDRFWRADPSRTRDTGGSGLGLAIVKHLVEAHGGTVQAASDASGATFTIHLPAADAPPATHGPSGR